MGYIIQIITAALAISGLLLQPRRNSNEPPSWNNLSNSGRVILALILTLGAVNIGKLIHDSDIAKHQQKTIDDLDTNNKLLIRTNQHLIKVMSVADGYNAHVLGVVTFKNNMPNHAVEIALRNLFLKFTSIDLIAKNILGIYHGHIGYSSHPLVERYLKYNNLDSQTPLLKSLPNIADGERSRSYFFDIRCENLKILNNEKIQYARFDNDPPVIGQLETFPEGWRDFRHLYGVDQIYVDRIVLEELGDVSIERSFEAAQP